MRSFRVLPTLVILTGVVLGPAAPTQATVWYVSEAAPGGDGTSWEQAFKHLQDALVVAQDSNEIRVAQGTYHPDEDSANPDGTGDRQATFQLINGVELYGGYAGYGHADPDERDIALYETILTGDLNEDDGPDFANNAENSYHVVTGLGTDETAVFEGFTVTAGNADGEPVADRRGGGMYNEGGSPTLAYCTFAENSARLGGGMCNYNGSNATLDNCAFSGNWAARGAGMFNYFYSGPTLTYCTFVGNSTGQYGSGGGMDNYDHCSPMVSHCLFSANAAVYGGGMSNVVESSPTMADCIFSGNFAASTGGGMENDNYCTPTLTNCVFEGNGSDWLGGGLNNNYHDSPTLINCIFVGNWADCGGGGMMNFDQTTPTMTNCVFSANSAEYGGGVYDCTSIPTLTNCLFSGNYADKGGGMYSGGSTATLVNCTFSLNSASNGCFLACGAYAQPFPSTLDLTNCVLWDGGSEIWNNDNSTIIITYSDVQGSWPGEGNIAVDPLFVDADGMDDIPGTADDDLRLSPGSPCIDAGDNTAVPPGITADLDGHPRFVDDPYTIDTGNGTPPIVDMGAYEFWSLPASVDLKPGACPNSFNRSSHGVLPVALLGSEEFDVTQVDVGTVQLSRVDGIGGEVAPHEGPPGPHSVYEDMGTPFDGETCDCHDAAGDGILDLSMKFKTDDVVADLLLNELEPGALVELVVRGSLLDGSPFAGSDCVRLVPPGTPPGVVEIQSSAAGAWVAASPFDLQLDGGGFADFERSYPLGSVVTFTTEDSYEGKRFVGWRLDGEFQTTDVSVGLTTTSDVHTVGALLLRPGDMDGDNRVDLSDFGIFAVCYGSVVSAPLPSCSPEQAAACDLDADGRVNLGDFGLFALHYPG